MEEHRNRFIWWNCVTHGFRDLYSDPRVFVFGATYAPREIAIIPQFPGWPPTNVHDHYRHQGWGLEGH